MTEISIPKHVAARIERRWAEKLKRERSSYKLARSMDVVHDRKARAIPVVRRRRAAAAHH